MHVNFFLKEPNNFKSTLQYKFYFNGKAIKRSTGITVESKTWHQDKQNVRRNNPNSLTINLELNKIKVKINDLFLILKDKTKTEFIYELDLAFKKDKKTIETLIDLFETFIDEREKLNDYKFGTIQVYKTTLNKLKFINLKSSEFVLDNIGYDFFTKFINFYNEHNNQNTTVHKSFRNIRHVMYWGLSKKFHQNYNFATELSKVIKNYDFQTNTKFSLTKEQLDLLENFDFKSEALNYYRDLFIIQTYLCLRYSELSQISKKNISNDIIKVYSTKDKEMLIKPLLPKIKKLIEKYDFETNKFISDQKYNKKLKQLFRIAEINEDILYYKVYGKKHEAHVSSMDEIMSNHISRNTYISLSLGFGLTEKEVMEVSGHKNVKTLQGYSKTTQQRAFDKSREIWR